MSTFLAWTHVYFISFDRINTVFCQCVFYFKLFSWLEYHTSSILLCSHGTYWLNRVCTTFNLSRLALSIIIFVTLFRVSILNLLFRYVWGGKGEGRGRGTELLLYLNFCLTTARGVKLRTRYLQYNWIRMMQIYFLWRSWIKKKRQSWIKNRVALLFFSESKQTE